MFLNRYHYYLLLLFFILTREIFCPDQTQLQLLFKNKNYVAHSIVTQIVLFYIKTSTQRFYLGQIRLPIDYKCRCSMCLISSNRSTEFQSNCYIHTFTRLCFLKIQQNNLPVYYQFRSSYDINTCIFPK